MTEEAKPATPLDPMAGFEASIQVWEPASRHERVKMLVHGMIGVGKTVLASQLPDQLFLSFERGMTSVTTRPSYREIHSWQEAVLALRYLRRGDHPYKSLVIDPVTELFEMCKANVVATFPEHKREYGDQLSQPDWGKALNDFSRYIRMVRDLPMRAILTAASRPPEYEGGLIRPAFQGKDTTEMVCRYMDVVAYMYLRPSPPDPKGNPTKATRILLFDSAQAETKDRTGLLPAGMVNPTWEKIERCFRKEKADGSNPGTEGRQ